ncbi:MAG: ABC transporter permease [Clostridia bacterium]|nr:ABC transporter permease [Clostridia bacterium]
MERDIKVKYRRSVLGILWSVLNPLLMMFVIATVFSRVFRFHVENFHVYYLTGSVIYNFISEATSTSMMSVFSSAPLIKKVYIPKYIFPLEKCFFSFVNLLFSLVAVVIVMLVSGIKFTFVALLFPVPILYALIFSIGMSLLLSALTVFFRDIVHIYGVFLTAWMYATPIIYPVEAVSEKIQFIMLFNPMYYYVQYFRDIVFYGTVPGLRFNLISIAFSLGMLVIGTLVFKSKQDNFVLYM